MDAPIAYRRLRNQSSSVVELCGAAVILGVVTIAATLVPARRAVMVDPLITLRSM